MFSAVPDMKGLLKGLSDAADTGVGLCPQRTGSFATQLGDISPKPHQGQPRALPRLGSALHQQFCTHTQHPPPNMGENPCQMLEETSARCGGESTILTLPQPPSPSLRQQSCCLHGHPFKLNLHLKRSQQMGKSVVWAEINLLKLSEE